VRQVTPPSAFIAFTKNIHDLSRICAEIFEISLLLMRRIKLVEYKNYCSISSLGTEWYAGAVRPMLVRHNAIARVKSHLTTFAF